VVVITDHFPLLIQSNQSSPSFTKFTWKLSKADWNAFYRKSDSELGQGYVLDLDDPVAHFTTILTSVAQATIPKSRNRLAKHETVWSNEECSLNLHFDCKPNQILPLGIRIQPDLQAVGFKQKDTLPCPISSTPWLLCHPQVNYSLDSLHKDDTAPEIFRHNFYELCAEYQDYKLLYTDGSRVASAVIWQKLSKTARLTNKASIFRAELYAISLAWTLSATVKINILSSFLTPC